MPFSFQIYSYSFHIYSYSFGYLWKVSTVNLIYDDNEENACSLSDEENNPIPEKNINLDLWSVLLVVMLTFSIRNEYGSAVIVTLRNNFWYKHYCETLIIIMEQWTNYKKIKSISILHITMSTNWLNWFQDGGRCIYTNHQWRSCSSWISTD